MRARGVKAIVAITITAGASFGCGKADAATTEASAAKVTAAKPRSSETCGGSGQVDCPLQHWMKATLQPYQRENSYPRLARAFEDLAQHAPAGYTRWTDLASSGAEAARNKDAAGVRATCKACHDEHRSRYRRERRAEEFM
jgi:hypothetical protein